MITCNYGGLCKFTVGDGKSFVEHRKVHMRQHIPAKNFHWWLGTMLNEFITRFEMTDGIGDYQVMDTVLYIEQKTLDAYTELYHVYLRDTCRNAPCMECIQKGIIRTMPEKKYMMYKMQQEGKYEPQRKRDLNMVIQ